MFRSWLGILGAGAVALAAAACGGSGGGGTAPPDGGGVTIERAFPNLAFTAPLYLTGAGDGTDRIFVVEQGGRILVFPNADSAASAATFLDLGGKIASGSEQGLLGLAFAPEYESSGELYVYYTAANPARAVLSRFRVDPGDADRADAASEEVLLEIPEPQPNHNGGMIAFGPDGRLYVGVGDGGGSGDPLESAQDPDSLLGKVLRIEVGAGAAAPYGIPADNPFASGGGRGEIYALGLRNPWRFSFDRQTGDLWLGDVGQSQREEIDLVVRGGNYGWDVFEGNAAFENPTGLPATDFVAPVLDYSRTVGKCVTGGYVYRGALVPSLAGDYVYGDFVTGAVFARDAAAGAAATSETIGNVAHLASFGEDEAGEVYLVSLDGTIHRFAEKP